MEEELSDVGDNITMLALDYIYDDILNKKPEFKNDKGHIWF